MKERLFIKKSKEEVNLEEFIRKEFVNAKIGGIEIQKTPIMTRVVLHTTTPGLIIGSGGERIQAMTEQLKEHFKIENPQIDVQKIENPNLDPNIIAKSIASQIETGTNYKRLANFFMEKIMRAGAVGTEIIITGKVSGERSRRERFVDGYIKKCGMPSETDVIKGFVVANPRLGNIGITVKIMIKNPVSIHQRVGKMVEDTEKKAQEEKEAAEEKKAAKKEVSKDDVKGVEKTVKKVEEKLTDDTPIEKKEAATKETTVDDKKEAPTEEAKKKEPNTEEASTKEVKPEEKKE